MIGPFVLHRSESQSSGATWNDQKDGSSYTAVESSPLLDSVTTPPASPHVRLVHEGKTESAVWAIGSDAFCKVRYIDEVVTVELTTLKAVQARRPSFNTPSVFFHGFGGARSYLFLQRLLGITLEAASLNLDENWRMHYVSAVVKICEEMAEWKRPIFGGVDGRSLPERYFVKQYEPVNFDSAKLLAVCEELGMDVMNFVFYYADLGPTNIIVEEQPSSGQIGIIGFEIAGFFPVLWIRTKFRLSGGMNLDCSDDPLLWRREVQKALGARGFEEVSSAWTIWKDGGKNISHRIQLN